MVSNLHVLIAHLSESTPTPQVKFMAKVFRLLGAVCLIGLSSTVVYLSANADVASESKFFLCSAGCRQSKYYVGYNRTNVANLGAKKSSSLIEPNTIFFNISNSALKKVLPDIDERKIDHEDGNFVRSAHRIENIQVGFSKKSEFMKVHANPSNSSTKATVKLLWGDTFTVTSRTLQKGVPVKVNIERIIGGFGNPVTDYAYYQASSRTFLNGKSMGALNFNLKKEPGPGQKDQMFGKDKMLYTINTKVGDTFTIESLQEVTDGIKVNAVGNQTLNGADSVLYKITLADESSNSACFKSASGTFNSGKCD